MRKGAKEGKETFDSSWDPFTPLNASARARYSPMFYVEHSPHT